MSWATLAQARQLWADAAAMPDDLLQLQLDVSTERLQAYVKDPDPDPLPARYVSACVAQAREQVNAMLRDGDVIGIGDYAVRARPLTAEVKSLLRPEQGRPRFGGYPTTQPPGAGP